MPSVLLTAAVVTSSLLWSFGTSGLVLNRTRAAGDDLALAAQFWTCCRQHWARKNVICVDNSCYFTLGGVGTRRAPSLRHCQPVIGRPGFTYVSVSRETFLRDELGLHLIQGDPQKQPFVKQSTSRAPSDMTTMPATESSIATTASVGETSPKRRSAQSSSRRPLYSDIAARIPAHVRELLDLKFQGQRGPGSNWFYGRGDHDDRSSEYAARDRRSSRRSLEAACNFTVPLDLYQRCFGQDYSLLCDRDQYEGTTVCPPVKTRRVTLAQQPMGSTHEVPCDNANGVTETYTCSSERTWRRTNGSCFRDDIKKMRSKLRNNTYNASSMVKELGRMTSHEDAQDPGLLSSILDMVGDLISRSARQPRRLQRAEAINFTTGVLTTLDNIAGRSIDLTWLNFTAELDAANITYTSAQKIRRKKREMGSRIISETEKAALILGCSHAAEASPSSNASESGAEVSVSIRKENIELKTYRFSDDSSNICFPACGGNEGSVVRLQGVLPLDTLPQACGDSTRVGFGTLFRNLDRLLLPAAEGSTSVQETSRWSDGVVNSALVGFSFGNDNNATVRFDAKNVVVSLAHLDGGLKGRPVCVFWNFSRHDGIGDWDDRGCEIDYWASGPSRTTCRCDHLTNFAVLMDMTGQVEDTGALRILTAVCTIMSIIALVITMMFLICVRSLHCRRTTIACNTCFCLLASNFIILIGFKQIYSHSIACMVVRSILLFALLSAFVWMLLEGYHLYRMLVVVFNHNDLPVAWFYCVGYGAPLIFTGVATYLTRNNFRPQFCWFAGLDIFYFCGPLIAIMSINSVVLVVALVSASKVKVKSQQRVPHKIGSWIKGSASLVFLLGITWALGLPLLAGNVVPYVEYIFTVVNGSQGVSMFVFHIAWNDKARSAILKMFKKKAHRTHFGKAPATGKTRKLKKDNSIGSQSSTKSTRVNSMDSSELTHSWASSKAQSLRIHF